MKRRTPLLADAAERERFITEHGKNISVIAPAGVGKTYGIVQRILALARRPDAENLLPRLVVVTFSVRAAQEIQQRARMEIGRAQVLPNIQRAFQQAFFGTIHSFCVRLLTRYGHFLGLPPAFALPASEDELWRRFLLHGARTDPAQDPKMREIFHFYTIERLYELGRKISPGKQTELSSIPRPNIGPLLNYHPAALAYQTRRAVMARQDGLKAWHEAWTRGDRFHPLPSIPEIKAPDFIALWREIIGPLQDWLRQAAFGFARCVANEYEAFRLGEGVLTYDDQVRQALRLLELRAVQRELAREPMSVLLDEAQDTDMLQFNLLLRVAGLHAEMVQAEDQTFCIVGDFQQAIWAPRSDLTVYRRIHEQISQEPTGLVSRLTVTFRCDKDIIDFVNRVFVSLLNGSEGQALFEQLRARHNAGSGQVARWICPTLPKEEKTADRCARHEARFLAEQLKRLQPAGVGADSWKDVAILCPRLKLLQELQRELVRNGVPAQLQSDNASQAGSTPRAWLAALVWVAAHPEDSFEIAGVLRDIFGVSDDAMAHFTGGRGELLRIDRPGRQEKGPVGEALGLLRRACEGTTQLPLHHAVTQLVERTLLRERLVSVQDEQNGQVASELIDQELDEILAGIFARGADGASLNEMARDLRDALCQSSPLEEEVRDEVQLYTWHKAKGLQWQTVIVPYVFRTFGEKSESYPRLVIGKEGEETIFRDSTDFKAGLEEFVQDRTWKQFQRLLYVACTRPQQTLLFIDDEELFRDLKRPGPFSAGKLLEFEEGDNRVIWQGLPGALEAKKPEPASVIETAVVPPAHPLARDEVLAAVAHANDIPIRVTPHSLAKYPSGDSEPEESTEREEPRPDGAGLLYGTWWHDLMEAMEWQADRQAWIKTFAGMLPFSPQAERSRREWALLLHSTLARWLASPRLVIHREFPFLLPGTDRCLEGVIDLAVYSPAEGSWRVVDWKTNRVDESEVVDIYRAQIEAYQEALRVILKAEVRGTLYLTATGVSIDL